MQTINSVDSEKLELKKRANLFRGIEAVGGWITITDKHVVFESHQLNIQAGSEWIPLVDIVSAGKRNTMFIVPNGMKITVRSGKTYKFVVWGRDELLSCIYELQPSARP